MNDGPEERHGTRTPGEQNDSPEQGGPAAEGFGPDELALRRLLHDAVETIEPTDGTLAHLRRAVPARRARKRQAVVGMAAAALFVGTAIPAFVHVSQSTGSNADPSIAANSSAAQGGASEGKGSDDGDKRAGGSAGGTKDKGTGGHTPKPDRGKGTGGGATAGGTAPSASAPSASACTIDQLGGASGAVAGPDATGVVYGSFSVSNISTVPCTVTGAGTVTAAAQGAADPARIGVANHVAGDAATGLPDPSAEPTSLVLQPGGSYVVKFAWVPSQTCPTVQPSPDPTPTEGATDAGGTTAGEGGSPTAQLLTEDGVQDGSVLVSSTAATGGATASVTVAGACAGTVYRTGLLPAA
ncbi:hypothetical protein ACGFS9_25560 [Streptomyces sp. NPDC048566]|uniref:hypothetical protein n=1 Tax=Streptomyces sp. NPDC048566 TaxID=3365569 RepID=UPI00371275A7